VSEVNQQRSTEHHKRAPPVQAPGNSSLNGLNCQPTLCQGITMEKLGPQLVDLSAKQLDGIAAWSADRKKPNRPTTTDGYGYQTKLDSKTRQRQRRRKPKNRRKACVPTRFGFRFRFQLGNYYNYYSALEKQLVGKI